ncbi:cell-division inhibitor [unidentified eubacterium SCB49]|nr:cell-division inhibitor [unidentified eubacterium SCB49]
MKTLIIAGGTGFLGNVLVEYFSPKVETIYILTRSKKTNHANVQYLVWDGKTIDKWALVFENADVLINMTGKSVDCRYTAKNKALILSSRITSTKILGEVIAKCVNPPKVWLNASTATIYRHSLDKEMDEKTGEIGDGFSVGIAKAWEQEFFSHQLKSTRKVALRTAIVFGKNGGAFVPIKKLAQLGFGGKQGNGNQKVSFIHELDFARSIAHIINSNIDGILNIVAPKPTTNRLLMQRVSNKLKMPFRVPLPTFLVSLGAKLINTEPELILKSRNVIPTKLLKSGFHFKYDTLDKTLTALI